MNTSKLLSLIYEILAYTVVYSCFKWFASAMRTCILLQNFVSLLTFTDRLKEELDLINRNQRDTEAKINNLRGEIGIVSLWKSILVYVYILLYHRNRPGWCVGHECCLSQISIIYETLLHCSVQINFHLFPNKSKLHVAQSVMVNDKLYARVPMLK